MAGTAHIDIAIVLLLLSLTGVNGFILARRDYDITFPCEEDLVCFHLWQINIFKANEYIAVVSNGEVRKAGSQKRKCTQQVKDLTLEDVGRHCCFHRSNGFSSNNTAPVLNLIPAKRVSLQCVVLSYVNTGYCPKRKIKLAWVDEAGVEIEKDRYHLINQSSPCDVTLTVTFQRPGNRTFRCQVTRDSQVKTSAELSVRARALIGKGKGLIIELEPEHSDGNRGTIGAAVGAVGCLVLTVLVAVLVVNRRRRRNIQLSDEPCSVQSGAINVMNTDDVIYANINLPVGSDRGLVSQCESTEYACVRYM